MFRGMTQALEALGKRMRFNEQLLKMATAGFEDAHWGARPEHGANSAHWILGHITYARLGMLRISGVRSEAEAWEDDFHKGVKPDNGNAYPSPAALIERFQAAGEALAARFGEMTEEDAEKPSPREFPDGSKSVDGAMHFMYFHETYHLGQVGYVRRLEGLDGFI